MTTNASTNQLFVKSDNGFSFQPILLTEIELCTPLPSINSLSYETKYKYRHARALVRLHSQPIGVVDLTLRDDVTVPEEYADEIWYQLHSEINQHLHQDGLPEIDKLTTSGVKHNSIPRCVEESERLQDKALMVSVVVATHNRTSSLALTLESLLNLKYPSYEVIVVDNAPSATDTADYIQENFGKSDKVRYVCERRPGLAIAHNRGIQEAKGSIIAFTDDDVIVDQHWLTEIVRGFNSADDVGCVTGLILPGEVESEAQALVEQYGGFAKGFRMRIFDLRESRLSSKIYPYAVGPLGSGANMSFRTDLLLKMHGFDPALGAGSLGMGGDDLSAFYQVITSGYKLVYQPAAIVHHWDPREYVGLQKRAYGYGVGLTAYLTKCLLDRPWVAFDVAVKLPFALIHIFSSRSSKNEKKSIYYPKELTRMERKGMLYGPIAYLRSRWRYRQARYAL